MIKIKSYLTTKEFDDMSDLVLNPSNMNSIKNLTKYIKAYANLELIQVVLLKELEKEDLAKLDKKVELLSSASVLKRANFIKNKLIVTSDDEFVASRQKFIRFYILHELNKKENTYEL